MVKNLTPEFLESVRGSSAFNTLTKNKAWNFEQALSVKKEEYINFQNKVGQRTPFLEEIATEDIYEKYLSQSQRDNIHVTTERIFKNAQRKGLSQVAKDKILDYRQSILKEAVTNNIYQENTKILRSVFPELNEVQLRQLLENKMIANNIDPLNFARKKIAEKLIRYSKSHKDFLEDVGLKLGEGRFDISTPTKNIILGTNVDNIKFSNELELISGDVVDRIVKKTKSISNIKRYEKQIRQLRLEGKTDVNLEKSLVVERNTLKITESELSALKGRQKELINAHYEEQIKPEIISKLQKEFPKATFDPTKPKAASKLNAENATKTVEAENIVTKKASKFKTTFISKGEKVVKDAKDVVDKMVSDTKSARETISEVWSKSKNFAKNSFKSEKFTKGRNLISETFSRQTVAGKLVSSTPAKVLTALMAGYVGYKIGEAVTNGLFSQIDNVENIRKQLIRVEVGGPLGKGFMDPNTATERIRALEILKMSEYSGRHLLGTEAKMYG